VAAGEVHSRLDKHIHLCVEEIGLDLEASALSGEEDFALVSPLTDHLFVLVDQREHACLHRDMQSGVHRKEPLATYVVELLGGERLRKRLFELCHLKHPPRQFEHRSRCPGGSDGGE